LPLVGLQNKQKAPNQEGFLMALDSLEIQDGGGGGNRTLSPHRPKTLAGRGFSSIFRISFIPFGPV
jgi:hypothetical protein